MLGAWVSFTVTRKVQVLLKPAPSVAFQITVVRPFGKVETLLGPLGVGEVPPLTHRGWPADRAQLSVAIGVG